jgi:hypothetical protein
LALAPPFAIQQPQRRPPPRARLQGHDLVVQTPTAIEITNADTGVFVGRWPLPTSDATLSDLQDGIAVLVAGNGIHLLRPADGTDKVIHVAGTGAVLAQLEPSGLFYSYTADDPAYPGRVVFVPRDQRLRHRDRPGASKDGPPTACPGLVARRAAVARGYDRLDVTGWESSSHGDGEDDGR